MLLYYGPLCGLCMFTGAISLVLYCFWLYQFFLVSCNTTSVESGHWADVRDHIRELEQKKRREQKKPTEKQQQPGQPQQKQQQPNQSNQNPPPQEVQKRDPYMDFKESDLINFYDNGLVSNVREMLFYDSFKFPSNKTPRRIKKD